MLIVKVSGNLQYKVGELQKEMRGSASIPRFLIMAETVQSEDETQVGV